MKIAKSLVFISVAISSVSFAMPPTFGWEGDPIVGEVKGSSKVAARSRVSYVVRMLDKDKPNPIDPNVYRQRGIDPTTSLQAVANYSFYTDPPKTWHVSQGLDSQGYRSVTVTGYAFETPGTYVDHYVIGDVWPDTPYFDPQIEVVNVVEVTKAETEEPSANFVEAVGTPRMEYRQFIMPIDGGVIAARATDKVTAFTSKVRAILKMGYDASRPREIAVSDLPAPLKLLAKALFKSKAEKLKSLTKGALTIDPAKALSATAVLMPFPSVQIGFRSVTTQGKTVTF
jgi:hypothetical protein